MPTNKRRSRREHGYRSPLSEEQIDGLAQTICMAGDDPRGKSEALLILMDEIEHFPRIERVGDITNYVRNIAFERLNEEDPGLMEAELELLRSEVPA